MNSEGKGLNETEKPLPLSGRGLCFVATPMPFLEGWYFGQRAGDLAPPVSAVADPEIQLRDSAGV